MDNKDSICKAGISLSVELNKFLKISEVLRIFHGLRIRIQDTHLTNRIPGTFQNINRFPPWEIQAYKYEFVSRQSYL